ncbi:MAG: hypothetical protein RJQ04_11225 [Longimicrobiales bacterium]
MSRTVLRTATAFGLATSILAAACTIQPARFGTRPGAPRDEPSAPSMDHEVQYHVLCRQCTVTYSAGSDMRHAEVEGSWSRSVNIEPTASRWVTLRASPTDVGGYVRRARISIDGRTVAEAERMGRSGVTDDVQLTAELP